LCSFGEINENTGVSMRIGVSEKSQAGNDRKKILHEFKMLDRFCESCNLLIMSFPVVGDIDFFFKGLCKTNGKVGGRWDFDESPLPYNNKAPSAPVNVD
jgi:hypothetical protein